MRLRQLTALGLVLVPQVAAAGGLLLPGSGAISTSRAGAAVASAQDGEALGINPAGLAKTKGTSITISAAIISYSMEFTREGTYDPIADEDRTYEGQPYQTVTNKSKPPLGIGSYQPIPVVVVASDLGGRVKGLTVAAGLYAPNAYPFRDMTDGYDFSDDGEAAPPPSRYDTLKTEAAVLLPSVAVAYRILPQLDVGARFSYGFAHVKSQVAVWGTPGNYSEAVTHDARLNAEAKDNFVPTFGFGAMYRPAPFLEFGLNFNWRAVVRAKGNASSDPGTKVTFNDQPTKIGPSAADRTRCAPGGTFEEQKICIDFQVPMNLLAGGRYLFLDDNGEMKGDIELNVGWENWGKRCKDSADFVNGCTSPGQFRIVIDSAAYVDVNMDGMLDESEIAVHLQENYIEHRFRDTYSTRLGGSYLLPVGNDGAKIVLRGGLAYDTRAAQDGWLRADVDGNSRITTTVGASYRTKKWEVMVGGGAILEGESTNGPPCNPTPTAEIPVPGCAADGTKQPIEDREGNDPVNPLVVPASQLESPVNKGTFSSHYVLLMLGFQTWF